MTVGTVADGDRPRLPNELVGQFYRRIDDLRRRLDAGALDFQRTMNTLQQVAEGRFDNQPQTVLTSTTFAPWRSIRLGGQKAEQLIKAVKAGYNLDDWAHDLMKQRAFTTAEAEETIETIRLTLAHLGFTKTPTTNELFDEKRLAEWSQRNLQGYVVELCPAEVGPKLRLQYDDQPRGEVVWVAMKPIADSVGSPRVFSVGCDDEGRLWLDAYCAYPDYRWSLGHLLVFRLRKVDDTVAV